MDIKSYSKNPNFRMREVNGEYYLFGEGKCFLVNQLGKIVWIAISKDITHAELIDKINAKYVDCNKEMIEKDIDAFLQQLVSCNAIVDK